MEQNGTNNQYHPYYIADYLIRCSESKSVKERKARWSRW